MSKRILWHKDLLVPLSRLAALNLSVSLLVMMTLKMIEVAKEGELETAEDPRIKVHAQKRRL